MCHSLLDSRWYVAPLATLSFLESPLWSQSLVENVICHIQLLSTATICHHFLFFLSSYNIPPFSPYPPIVTGQDTPADRWETLSEFSKLTCFSAIILLLRRVKGLCRLSISNGSLTSHFMQMVRCLSVTLTLLWQVDLLFTRTTFRPECPRTLLEGNSNIWETMDPMIVYYVHIYYSIWDFLLLFPWFNSCLCSIICLCILCAVLIYMQVFMCECTLWLHSNPLQ